VTRIRFFRMSLVLMIVLAGTGVFGSCSDVCGCPPVLPPSQIIGRVIDESGAGVGGTELKARVGAGFAMASSISSGYFVLYGPGGLSEMLIEITPPAAYAVAEEQANPVLVKLAFIEAPGLEIRLRRRRPVQ
jgi:hypothetical protein